MKNLSRFVSLLLIAMLLILMIAPFLSRPAHAEAWSGGFDPSALTEALPESAQSIAETYGEDGLFRYEGALEKLWTLPKSVPRSIWKKW